MLHPSDDFKVCTLPEGKYRTVLEVMEGILRCLKEFDPLPTSTVEVYNQWNVTFKSQDEWVAITVPVAQILGWLTREKTIRPGVQNEWFIYHKPQTWLRMVCNPPSDDCELPWKLHHTATHFPLSL